MSDPRALVRDGKLVPEAIAAAAAAAPEAGLASGDSAERAAAAIACGLAASPAAIPGLLASLDDDGLAGRAAAWALGQLPAETQLREALDGGSLDVRENAYRALAIIAARGAASGDLAESMRERIAAELGRAAEGRTSLAEHATRVLAVLGSDDAADLIQRVVEADSFADRFELQRQRKQFEADGRDREAIAELTAPWTEQFADELAGADEDADERSPSAADVDLGATPSTASEGRQPQPARPAPAPQQTGGDQLGDDDAEDESSAETAEPVDWEGFFASAEFTGLDHTSQQIAQQLAPMLDQLAGQVAGIPLTALSGQELAGLLLQVLPQAAPPQVVQTALSPQALNGFQALARFLERTGASADGADLVQGIKLVRQTIREQVRQSGMLGGPDYSDPDDADEADPAT